MQNLPDNIDIRVRSVEELTQVYKELGKPIAKRLESACSTYFMRREPLYVRKMHRSSTWGVFIEPRYQSIIEAHQLLQKTVRIYEGEVDYERIAT